MSTALKTGQNSNESKVENFSLFTQLKNTLGDALTFRQRAQVPTTFETLVVGGKNDSNALALRVDRKGNLITGNYTPELLEAFEGATLNVQKWVATNTTFAPVQTTIGGYNFNPTSLTTANAVAILQSQRLFYKFPRVPLQIKVRLRANIATNANADFGFGVPSGTTVIVPNGVAVRIINGLWYGVVTFNGAELATPTPLIGLDGITQLSTANLNSEFFVVDIVIDDDNTIITVQNTQTGDLVGVANIPLPLSSSNMWAATALPFYVRTWNGSVAPFTASIFVLSYAQVLSTDWNLQSNVSQLAGLLGFSAGRNPFSGAQLENHTNSTAPVSATLSNTAAGYTTLGGKFQFAAVAGAVTDYALFGFQVPAGSRFVCEGVTINTRNTGVAVATTASTLEWAMGFNSSAVSLATANIIRRQIGHQSFAIGAAAETIAPTLDVDFTTPEVVESGRFLHLILTLPVGTATASQILRGTVLVKGRFI
jgi:hypothetical protein